MADDIVEARKAVFGRKEPKAEDIVKYLGLIRTYHSARPEEVYSLGKALLKKHSSKLKEADLWNAREDLAIGCIQLGKEQEALDIVDKISSKFPSSCRASRLRGMYLESLEKSEEARSIYDNALKTIDSQNLMMVHRVIALRKGKGDIAGALDLLHKHLSMQLGDWQCWYEAGKLHARRGSYSEAIYCLEEVLMHQPGDLAVHLLLADCLYASGVVQVARKYYSSVVEMSRGTNVKALYGLCLCTSRLKTKGVDVVCGDLGKAAGETLLNEYAKINSEYTIPVKNLITEV